MFRRHRNREDGTMSAEASLAEAEACRRAQERKHAAEQPLKQKMDRLAEEDDIAARLRVALGGGPRR